MLMFTAGCSSLGLSLFPTGHYLTDEAEEVLDRSPRNAPLPRELDQGVLHTHFLQPGDVLLIEPVDLNSEVRIPADQRVLADGTIDLGSFGRLVVAGMTLESTESLIERTILDAGEERTQINVRLLEPVHRYYILGEVNSPGSYPLDGHESVLDGILAAGGMTSAAAPCRIVLARPTQPHSCRVTLPVCYREITQLGDTTTNYQLQPGDRVFVASRTWCEEFKFWQATKTCDRCGGCQFPCSDPEVATFVNPITRVPPATGSFGGHANSDREPESTHDISEVDMPKVDFPENGIEFPENNGPVPSRLPAASADGELEFEFSEPLPRFEPLEIAPATGESAPGAQPAPQP